MARDVDPVFGLMPVSALTEVVIAQWIKQLGGSDKTISNKHGFLSGAHTAAVPGGRDGVQSVSGTVPAAHPSEGDRVPDASEVALLLDNIPSNYSFSPVRGRWTRRPRAACPHSAGRRPERADMNDTVVRAQYSTGLSRRNIQ
jgi:hypothetical protein